MEKKDWRLVGICGIYCGDCPSYLAHRMNDVAELEARAKRTGFTLEEVCCDGCHSDKVMPSCLECGHGFRQCAREHQVTWCFECSDFPCQRLEDFKYIHIENGISHHEHLVKELFYLRENGIDAWLEKKALEAKCTQCGKRVYWCTRWCPNCGANLR
jgi:hypothetical protein